MNPLRLIWSAEALDDLRMIIDYIAPRNASAAERLLATIQNAAEQLPHHPYMYRLGRVPGTREALVHPNYIMVYSVGQEAIEILALVHARQQYP